MPSETVVCPGCGRRILAPYGRYNAHDAVKGVAGYCFMAGMPSPIDGRSEMDMEAKARIVASLAVQVQDEDPAVVWRYLTAVPAVFMQELLQIALAAIPVENNQVKDIWRKWVAA